MSRMLERIVACLQVDFCPKLNRYVYWIKSPIGWIACAILLNALLGIYVSQQAFYALGALAGFGLVGCAWPWISLRYVRASLSFGQLRCEEGSEVETSVEIRNRGLFSVWGASITCETSHDQGGEVDEWVSLKRVPAFATSRYEWTTRFVRRGIYPRATLRIRTAFPFGLWHSARELQLSDSVVVWPRCYRLSDVPQFGGRPNYGYGSFQDRAGDDGDWTGCRGFRPGDTLRRVSWRHTAKRESLVVFEHQSSNKQSASVWIDPQACYSGGTEASDVLIRCVSSLTVHMLSHCWELSIPEGGEWKPLRNDGRSRARWLDRLAAWTPSSDERPLPWNRMQQGLALVFTDSDLLEQRITDPLFAGAIFVVVCSSDASKRALDRYRNVFAISMEGKEETQIQSVWARLCRKASALSGVVA